VAAYLRALPAGSLLLDVGAGNGKYLAVAREVGLPALGVDRCAPLADICGGRGQQAVVGDALRVPVRSGSADAVLSVAVLHHLSTLPRRVAAVAELLRCVRPGGQVLIYAWAKEQDADSRREFSVADVLVPWCLKRHFVRGGGGGGGGGDATAAPPPLPPGAVVDEARDVIVLQRYCHVHARGEVEALLAAAAEQLGGRVEAGAAAPPGGADAGDALTAQLAAFAAGLPPPRQRGASDGAPPSPTFRSLLSWLEAGNWCALVQRDA
jgi:SAM-dependent methyltransferase